LQLTYNWKIETYLPPPLLLATGLQLESNQTQNAFTTSLLATGLQLAEELNCTSAILSSETPIFFAPAEPQHRNRQADAPPA
jgi:hypothetical protein